MFTPAVTRTLSLPPRRTAAAVALALLAGQIAANAVPFTVARERWDLRSPELVETSGLAASRRDDQFLWAMNDSGNTPDLFLIDPQGGDHGKIRLTGARNVDWEDLDSFVSNGVPYILVADTGDNRARHAFSTIYIVPEPDVRSGRVTGTLAPAWSIRFKFPDGPRDCEAVAADPQSGKILLISKRTWPPVLYEIPLARPKSNEVITATRLGPVNLPKPGFFSLPFAGQTTGLSLSPDGRLAAVLTYTRVFLFPRAGGESWAAAFARKPIALARHGLEQAEGIAFSRDGRRIHVVSEGRDAPVVTYRKN